jgi:hypothetical protein
LYKKHVTPSDSFSEDQKHIMLQYAVNGIMELPQVKNTDRMGTTSGTMMSTPRCYSVASAYDDQFKATKSNHHVMLHEFHHAKVGPGDDHCDSDGALFDI